ncbi:ScyD/ScyE family protein [Nocardioides pantholopis]|uniref:ScyD/ScyE family protein n=1 Tax=Nocardioides pantholopis TaxID=2483798 RepID=UPI0013E2F885|nr:ScyD/ScyE family protein [Nocardioides pantholopis]
MQSRLLASAGAAALLLGALVPAATAGHGDRPGHHGAHPRYDLRPVTTLTDARGLDALGGGRSLVSEGDGTFSLVVERRGRPARVVELGSVAPGFAPAVALGRRGTVYILIGAGEPGTGAATLYRWRRGWDEPRPLADIGAYQASDPDPTNQEGDPAESNPFGLAVLPDGSAVVADAANNDVLRVTPSGAISTLARLSPRTVEVPDGLPATDPEGNPLPPAGTPIPAEAVATSVAVGSRGEVYVGELRGFPATPGSSQVWRIRPGAAGATCDPERPDAGSCTRVADGLTSIVDLAVDRRGTIYAASLSTMSWLQWELGTEGAEVGGLFRITPRPGRPGRARVSEILPGRFVLPGGVDTVGTQVYVLAPTFGPSTLSRLVIRHRH